MLGGSGRCGWNEQINPLSYASSVQFWDLHLYRKLQGSHDAGTGLEHPQLAFLSEKERWKPATLNGRGPTGLLDTHSVCPQGALNRAVSATRNNEAASQLCYLGFCLGENMSLEEASCFISTLAA